MNPSFPAGFKHTPERCIGMKRIMKTKCIEDEADPQVSGQGSGGRTGALVPRLLVSDGALADQAASRGLLPADGVQPAAQRRTVRELWGVNT